MRFCHCADKQQCLTQTSFEYIPSTGETAVMYDHKHEEYAADFVGIAKRTLNDFEYRLFSYHYLLGADWKLCCSRLKIDRGEFFHAVYRVQQKLGRAYRETEPYPLFPVYEYFEEERRDLRKAAPPPKASLPGFKRPGPEEGPRVQPQRTDQPYPSDRPSTRRRRIA